MSVYLFVTLDTKGPEAEYVRMRLRQLGVDVKLIDTSCLGEISITPEISREEVYAAAGTSLTAMQSQGDRGAAVTAAALGAANLVQVAFQRGEVTGVMSLGGSAGTTIGTAAMRALPLGIPKLMVSTLASGQTRPYVQDKDILLLNSVVDIAGVNRISRRIFDNACAALAGMVLHATPENASEQPLIAATMFGVTTPCVQHARQILEAAGYEVLVFHATGNGGMAMESLIRDGLFAGVLDLTTTELADELVGGILSAGSERLTAAAACGVPQVVSVGALDMVNFGATTPKQFEHRLFHKHNATVTLMRTTPEECRQLGAEIARKVSASTGPAAILLPKQGISGIDRAGQSFDDPVARAELFNAIRENVHNLEVIEFDCHINDVAFAAAAAHKLLDLIAQRRT